MRNFWLDYLDYKALENHEKPGIDDSPVFDPRLTAMELKWLDDTFSRLVAYCAWQYVPEPDRQQYQLDLMKVVFKAAVMYKQHHGFARDEKMMIFLKRIIWKCRGVGSNADTAD